MSLQPFLTFSVSLFNIFYRVDNIVLVLSEVSVHGRALVIVGFSSPTTANMATRLGTRKEKGRKVTGLSTWQRDRNNKGQDVVRDTQSDSATGQPALDKTVLVTHISSPGGQRSRRSSALDGGNPSESESSHKMGDRGTQRNPGMPGAWLTEMHQDMMNLQKESMENMHKTLADSCATMMRSVAESFATQLRRQGDSEVNNQDTLGSPSQNSARPDVNKNKPQSAVKRPADTLPQNNKRGKVHEISDSDDGELSDAASDADMEYFFVQNQSSLASGDSDPGNATDDLCDDLDTIARAVHAQFELDDDTGPPINASVRDMMEKLFRKTVPDAVMKNKMDMIKCPDNCEYLIVPKLNPEIWAVLKSGVRNREIRTQKLQRKIIKAITMVAHSLDSLTEHNLGRNAKPADIPTLIKNLFGVIGILSSASQELNQFRNDEIKPVLPQKFKPLCSSQHPVTANLFGDDLAKSVKDLNETSRLSSNLVATPTPFKGKTRYAGKGKAFLGQRRGYPPFPNAGYPRYKNNFRKRQECAKPNKSA